MMPNRLSKPDDIVWRKVGDEIVVIKDDGLAVHVLNKTAAMIWEMSSNNCGDNDIADKICECFSVSSEDAVADVENTIAKLKEIKLLNPVEEIASQ